MHFNSSKDGAAYSVACLGLDWRVELSLKSLLGLLKDRMPVAWHHSDDINADVIVYNPASPLAQALLRRESSAGRLRVMVPCSASDPGPAGLTLPIGATRLLHCLAGASARLGLPALARGERASLCQRLDDILHGPGAMGVIVSFGGQRGLLNPALRTIHWPSELDADAIARLILEDVEIEPLHEGQDAALQVIAEDALDAMPWDAPLWAVGVGASGGRLLRRLDPGRPYRLSRWPDFGVLGRRGPDIKCAALLTQRELSPEALVALSGLPQAKVHGFVNACALCGLLEEPVVMESAPPPAAPVAASFAGGMLKRIRRALALGGDWT